MGLEGVKIFNIWMRKELLYPKSGLLEIDINKTIMYRYIKTQYKSDKKNPFLTCKVKSG